MTETITIEYMGMTAELTGVFTQGRPAPKCSDPDSAAFADPGEPDEVIVRYGFFVGKSGGTHYTPVRCEISPEMLEAIEQSGEIEAQLWGRK